jgi:hypothetical protein
MKQDEIIEMARQAGFETQLRKGKILGFDRDGDYTEELEAFAKLVAAKEREACAKECEHTALRMGSEWMAQHCAEAIRARGAA